MKNIYLLGLLFFVIVLSSCTTENSDDNFKIDEDYVLSPLSTVSFPIVNDSQDENVKGYTIEQVSVTDIEWETIYETDDYSILSRDVPDDMFFVMLAYIIEAGDDQCTIGAKTRYQYIIKTDNAYYDVFEYHQKYHNLTCDMLDELDIQ